MTDDSFGLHDPGPMHPESVSRHGAMLRGIGPLADATEILDPREATVAELQTVHSQAHIDAVLSTDGIERVRLDADTATSAHSARASVLAAGAGLSAIDHMTDSGGAGRGGATGRALALVRPPGHHATSERPMGFCLFNSIAVTAANLTKRHQRVAIVDFDAHHGNGTQDIFYEDPDVLFISLHQWPFYPGTGAAGERGSGPGEDATINIPLPAGTTGYVYRRQIEQTIGPALAQFAPDWLLYSAGFDSHRDDPLTQMGLTSEDFGLIATDIAAVVGNVPTIAFVEGGYDLDALADSVNSFATALLVP